MKRIYLDYAATTPAAPEVVAAMLPYFGDIFGNPSSIYFCGQEAKKALEQAREKVSQLIGSHEDEIVFTSGGTEADNFAIKGVAFAKREKGNHIITSCVEHHAVIETCRFLENNGYQVTYLRVDKHGLVDPDDVKKAITPKTILISIMHANNEVGTIQPIAKIGQVAKDSGIYFHTDAVQTTGHIPINVGQLNVDLLSISAHKLYGPKGIGALYLKKGTKITPFIHGGEQEDGRRAGTENVPGAVGFGRAAEMARGEMEQEAIRLTLLRDKLINGLQENITELHLNGHPRQRLPNNVNVSIAFVEGEAILVNLDLEGICASTGSACSSASNEPSHVLIGMGLPPEQARGLLRFTSGKWTTDDDIERVLEVLPGIVKKLRAISSLHKSSNA